MEPITTRRNLGIVAHADAGKTTTTEHMLFESGRIRTIGRVDDGTAHTDWLEVERKRGISVRSAVTSFDWNDCQVNLIDTPGHVDFAGEVERSLRILDGAVLILSAVEGVQAHTETLWRGLRALRIPTLIYVNKVDRVGVSLPDVHRQIRQWLTSGAVPITQVNMEGPEFSQVWSLLGADSKTNEAGSWLPAIHTAVYEQLANTYDDWLDRYVQEDVVSSDELLAGLKQAVHHQDIVPIMHGASLRGLGVRELLDAMVELLPGPSGDESGAFSGSVFKVERHPVHGRATYVRVYQGTLQNRDLVFNRTRDVEEKVNQIRKVHVQQQVDLGIVRAGDIAAVYGLASARVGDVLGTGLGVPPAVSLSQPLLTVQVEPVNAADELKLANALAELDDEDPTLQMQWLQTEREFHIKLIGTMQLDVIRELLLGRYQVPVRFGQPTVIYKETPIREAQGFVAYTMPKPCWAVLRFHIEPGPRGSGLVYSSQVRPDRLLQRYQNEVERRVPEALEQGLYGWEVTDLKVMLVDGEHHVWHTHPLDFVIATPMGIMDGLAKAGTQRLEPILEFRVTAPEAVGGRIMSDLAHMRAEFDAPVMASGHVTVEGLIPLATSLNYTVELAMLSGGRATWMTRLHGYRECPPDVDTVRPRRGVNPLDTARYILSVRNALSSQE